MEKLSNQCWAERGKADPVRRQVRYLVVIMALILAGCGDTQQQGTSVKEKEQKSTERMAGSGTPAPQPTVLAQKLDAPMLTYDVVDLDTYDAPIKTQISIYVVVSGTLTEFGLEQLLQKLYDEANATRGFKYHGGKPTHVFINLYTSRDHFKSGMGQWIARLSKVGEGSRVETQVRTELITQLDAKPEVKHGLPESKRKEIFRAILTAEARADADAQRMYPLPDPNKSGYSQPKAIEQINKQVEAFYVLTEKYKSEVAKQYSITQEQLRNIAVEGLPKNWPRR